MLGLEQYLQHHPDPFAPRNPYDDSDEGYDDAFPSSGLLSEDITDVDEKRDNEVERPEQEQQGKPLSLLQLLSGKQNSKKKKQKKQEDSMSFDEPYKDESETVTLTSSDILEPEVKATKPETVEQLEQRMYNSKKSMSAMDLLKSRRQEKKVESIPPEECVEIVSDRESSDNELVQVVENRTPGVNVRDIFSNFAPKRVKTKDGNWKLNVKLKISPSKLAEIKKYDDPLRTRGNIAGGNSMFNMLMHKKPSKMVTLRLPSDFLESIQKSLNPLYTKSSGTKNGKSASNVFAQMMQSASTSAYPKLTPLQKAKELEPPSIERGQMHIREQDDCATVSNPLESLVPRSTHTPDTSKLNENFFTTLELNRQSNELKCKRRTTISTVDDLCDFVADRAPLAFEAEPHIRIYKDFIQNQSPDSNQLWPDKFAPRKADQLLLDHNIRYALQRWIENAFAILKTQSTKTPRNIKIKEQQQKQRQRNTMQGFIVDDLEEDSEETEEDVFVPVLIIQGLSGSGKSASVYAAMNSMDGYVYEINSGLNRSRRELYGPLKEFCTTNIINKKDQEKKFQRGLVFFEDCDVLFEQDKTFWVAVQDVINFSKRPIVLSVQDPSVIPKSIWEQAAEQNAVLSFENNDISAFEQYIWLCCFSQGFDLTELVLSWVSKQNNLASFDLRGALMASQWICAADEDLSSDEVLTLDFLTNNTRQGNGLDSLSALSDKYDLLSAADIIESNMCSLKLQETRPNELLDLYVVDDGETLHPSPEPEECNIGSFIKEMVDGKEDLWRNGVTFNQIRETVLAFIASRTKKMPKILQEYQSFRTSTRSRSYESSFDLPMLDTQGLPDTSVCYSMNKLPFILDLAAYARHWARFQISLDNVERERRERGEDISLQTHLGWRRFQSETQAVLSTFPLSNR